MSRRALGSQASSTAKPGYRISKKHPHSKPRNLHGITSPPKKSFGDSLASDQRAVFDWYEKNEYKDDAGDIFSPEWQCRLTDWRNNFDAPMKTIHDQVKDHQQSPEDLEFGLFFRAHSIAAFSLWHVLQACYDLDRRVCGKSTPEKKEVAAWQSWRPFQYLLSKDIILTWEGNLVSFSSEVMEVERGTNKFQKEAIASRLYSMAEGVHELEECLSIVESVFKGNRKNMTCSYWMLELIRKAVEDRCRAMEKHIINHQNYLF